MQSRLQWLQTARPDQITPPGADWSTWALIAGRGAGKGLPIATPIPVPTGWAAIGDLMVGDMVFDEAGRPCGVMAVFDYIPKFAYRLTFSDGTWIDACDEHQWVTWTHADRKSYLRSQYEADPSRPPADWPNWRPVRHPKGKGRHVAADGPGPRTRTTQDVVDTITHSQTRDTNHSIPVCGALDLPEIDLPFDPWALGYWLGNGTAKQPEVTGHIDDEAYVLGRLPGHLPVRRDKRGHRCFTVRAPSLVRAPVVCAGRTVPAVYLRASARQRLELLRGLLDSDGHCANGNAAEFTSTIRALAEAVVELARSLGQKPVLSEGRAMLNGVDCGPKWRVLWRPTIQVFGSPRKAGALRLNEGAQGHRNHHRMIVSAVSIEPTPMRCISVDGPNAMYLCGEGMIPTHNTRTGAEDAAHFCIWNAGVRQAVVGPTKNDLRRVLFEGDSGLINVIPHQCLKGGSLSIGYNKTLSEITFWNGSKIEGFSSEEPDRLRGPQFHRAWVDELAAWRRLQETWDMLQFGLRLKGPAGTSPQVLVTTTPRPLNILKEIMADTGTVISRSSTYANKANLASSFLTKMEKQYEGTRLGRQELHGEVLEDTPGALWRLSTIDAHRRRPIDVPTLTTVVIAIDPAASNEPGSDETGIVCVAKGEDGHGYVLDDMSMKGPPVTDGDLEGWCNVAVDLYKKRRADRIIGEVNNGGDMVEAVLRAVEKNVPFKAVHASRGKAIRAEPVSSLYARGLVHHVGAFSTLEDQMTAFTSDFDRSTSGYSPDRMDALVWGLTELFVEDPGQSGIFDYFRGLHNAQKKAAG